MPGDYFKEDILENAISTRQRERSERREDLRARKEQQMKRAEQAAARAKQRRRLFLVLLAVLVVAGVLVGSSLVRIIALQKEKAEAQARLDELKQRIELLESELTRVTSDEYIEQQARTHLKMIYPGETLYIVVPPEGENGETGQ
jgi:cell division protein FtsL